MNDLVTKKRCAVYARVSTDERLDQSFNSLDAQREAGHAYVASQRAEGWIPVADDYDDGGYSGGNMERPALKRVLMSGDTTLNPAKMTAEGITFVRKPVRAARLAEAIGGQRAN